jgi:hypothetical protein
VGKFQHLVSERGRRFEAAPCPGEATLLAPRGGRPSVGEQPGGDGEHAIMGNTACDRCSVESHEDHRPGEYVSRSQVRAS